MLTPQEKAAKLRALKDPQSKAIEAFLENLRAAQGEKGEKGDKGDKGDAGYTPIPGKDYFTQTQANSFLDHIQSKVKDGKDGKDGARGEAGATPIRGVHYWTTTDKSEIVSEVLSKVKNGVDGKSPDINEIVFKAVAELKKTPIDFKDIKGTEQLIKFLKSGGFRGGGSSTGGGSGTVTSITAGTGLSGGTITTSGTVSLANTAVTPGAYTSANITIDQQGRITAAANGTGGGGSSTLAAVSTASTTTPNSLYTMTSTIPVEFKTSGGTHLLYLDETNGRIGIGTNAPTSALDILGDFTTFRVRSTGATQFDGAGFYLINTAASMGNQAGASFYMGINDAGATQGFLALDKTNTAGGGTGHLALFDYNSATTTLYQAINAATIARTSGASSYFTVNAPADTGITTATESIGVNYVGATRTWVDGTVATQREYLFQAPTYNKTTTSATFTKAATLAVSAAPIAGTGVTITNPYAFWVQGGQSQFDGNIVQNARYTKFGNASPNNTALSAGASPGLELWGNDNTISGVQMGVGNANVGIHAYSFVFMNNDLASDNLSDHYAGLGYTSSAYNDTTFGTGVNVASQFQLWNTDGPTTFVNSSATPYYINWLIGGVATTNEGGRLTPTGLTVGLAGTTTGAVKFAGATSGTTTITGPVTGAGTLTLQAVTDTIAVLGTAQTFTAKQQITLTTNQFQLNYDGSNNATFTVASNGVLAIGDSAGVVTISGSTSSPYFQTTASPNNFYNPLALTISNTATAQLQFAGSAGNGIRTAFMGSTSTQLTANYNYSAVIVTSAPVTAAATGTHAWLANLVVNKLGTVTNGSAIPITNTTNLYVDSPSAGGTNNYSAYIAGATYITQGSGNQLVLAFDSTHVANFSVDSTGVLKLSTSQGTFQMASGALSVNNLNTAGSGTAINGDFSSNNTNSVATSSAAHLFAGAASIAFRNSFYGNTSSVLGSNASYASNVFASAPITTATATNTVALLANIVINPIGTVTVGGGTTITNTASLYINGASSATVTGGNYAFYVAAGLSSFQGGFVNHRTTVADVAYTALVSDYIIAYTTLTTARAVTLATTANYQDGQVFIIKDEAGTAGTNNITVTPATGNIDGAASKVINANYGLLRIYKAGSNFFTF